jgi:hypothetical protein
MSTADHLVWVHPMSARLTASDDAQSELGPGGWTLHLPEGRHMVQFPVQTPTVVGGQALYLLAVSVMISDAKGPKMQETAKIWVYDNDMLLAVEEQSIPRREWGHEISLALPKPHQVRSALLIGIGLGAGSCIVGPASCRLSLDSPGRIASASQR